MEQVQKCSLNLVDVIDHLLDFAQINNKVTSSRPSDRRRDQGVEKLPLRNKTSSCVSLGRTTEAIVDAVFYSHYFTKHDRTQPHVDLVMDLTPRSATHCMISVGAWKRLCTNIVNNALKYTPAGHVKVYLDLAERDDGETYATMIVSDTGIGMSPEFLRENLFKSFAQEDSFAAGTGLGMSLVAELIKEFRGEIEVTSKKNEGTRMTVTIPLEIPQDGTGMEPGCKFDDSDVSVGYFEPHEAQEDKNGSRQALIDAAKQTLRNIGVVVGPSNNASINVILEEHFMQLPSDMHTEKKRCLVLCDSFASATRLRERFQGEHHVQFVPQPYGPERLSTAIQVLCGRISEQADTVAGSDPPSSKAASEPTNSLMYTRERAISTLPSPPLDVVLDYLTLSSPSTATVKAAARDSLVDLDDQVATHTFSSPGRNAATGSRRVSTHPPKEPTSISESFRPSDSLLLLLVDDNVSATIIDSGTILTT